MLLEGKRGLIVGIANKRSLAWGIAQSVAREGARLAVTYQGERLERNVRKLADELVDPVIVPCDVTNDDEMDAVAASVKDQLGGVDFMVHAVAFAMREELDGEFVDTSREGYRLAQDISAYSLTALSRRVVPLMPSAEDGGGSIVTLSYLGGERVVPNYNVMGVAKAALEASVRYLASDLGPDGIRVNAISAGPMRTLAGSAVADARYVFRHSESASPLGRNLTPEEVGGAAVYLLSPLAGAVTGEVHHVDSGFNTIGIPRPR